GGGGGGGRGGGGGAGGGPAVAAAGRAVGLLERAEDGVQVLVADADAGVGYRDGERPRDGAIRRRIRGDPQFDPALLGELDRVGQQVVQDLPEPLPVGVELRRELAARCGRDEGEAFF